MTELQGKIHCIQIPILGTNCLVDSSEVACDFSIDDKSPKSADMKLLLYLESLPPLPMTTIISINIIE